MSGAGGNSKGKIGKLFPFLQISGSAVIAWASGWLVSLEGTGIGHPIWEISTRKLGVSIGAALSIAFFAWTRLVSRRAERIAFYVLLGCFVVSLVLVAWMSTTIDTIPDKDTVLFRRDVLWKWSYFLLCISFVLIIPATAGLLKKR